MTVTPHSTLARRARWLAVIAIACALLVGCTTRFVDLTPELPPDAETFPDAATDAGDGGLDGNDAVPDAAIPPDAAFTGDAGVGDAAID